MPPKCPKRTDPMEQRKVESHYGTRLFVYKCSTCSGIWVDGKVASAISRDAAVEVESDVLIEEISAAPRETEASCPRCATYLTEQAGGTLPKGLRLDYCPTCNGYWFDKGELMIYKSYLENRRQELRKSQRDSEVTAQERRVRRERARQAVERPTYTNMGKVLRAISIFLSGQSRCQCEAASGKQRRTEFPEYRNGVQDCYDVQSAGAR